MTADEQWRALCRIDPALQPWQKCSHEWGKASLGSLDFLRDAHPITECPKCGKRFWGGSSDWTPPAFGDGNATRYSTVDSLLALAERLGLHHVSLSSSNKWTVFSATVCHLSPANEAYYALGQGPTAVAALTEAILRSQGEWRE